MALYKWCIIIIIIVIIIIIIIIIIITSAFKYFKDSINSAVLLAIMKLSDLITFHIALFYA